MEAIRRRNSGMFTRPVGTVHVCPHFIQQKARKFKTYVLCIVLHEKHDKNEKDIDLL